MKKIGKILFYDCLIPFLAALPFLFINMSGISVWINVIGVPIIAWGLCFLFRKQIDGRSGAKITGISLFVLLLLFTAWMIVAKGNTEGAVMMTFFWLLFPFAPIMLVPLLMNLSLIIYLTALLTYIAVFVFCLIRIRSQLKGFLKRQMQGKERRKLYACGICILLCLCVNAALYMNRPAVRYQGHGFDYMNGYSSTDFTDYTVYAKKSKLAQLDHKPAFQIEKEEDMPVMDGAEACYPLYAAIAKTVYRDIDQIEQMALKQKDSPYNGRIVTFTNTVYGLERLIYGGRDDTDAEKFGDTFGVDLFFGGYPSEQQLELARQYDVEIEITPIGKEAFVFFVEEDNPVVDLTSEQVRAIYHGDIRNWKEVGGKNQPIIAFQRPVNSGSQTRMLHFMGDVTLQEPKSYEMVSAMDGVIKKVAQYANEEGAIGYTFRYFLEELNQEKGVRMLKIDGIEPTVENLRNGSYPLSGPLCLITRKNDPNPNVQKMIDFILSEDGQELIEKTGYAPMDRS